jgi:hypothetical protein
MVPTDFLAADLTYFQIDESEFTNNGPGETGNCFKKNKPKGYTYLSSEDELPTDGC